MCGRYSIGAEIQALAKRLEVTVPPDFEPNYNAAPSQRLPIVSNYQPSNFTYFQWGIVPFWAKEEQKRLINARAETILEKATFKKAFKKRRCLVAADGYYEWMKTEQGKQPYRICRVDETPFVFAGIWDRQNEFEDQADFCIVTTSASPSVAHIHNRMPVILHPDAIDFWLSDTEDYEGLQDVLRPMEDKLIKAYQVSKKVNNVQNNEYELIEKIND
ncbi:putative SOS response-associated peptidase YedK [Catalinimonas alkaloidigena]|uniref:SOS response-associated peptidase n=1 Tax=Catalinimonas alkaloidigena TaxID=1075417 RepID=UPI002406F580|nr:SOS response-associated peptidase [Catalinimonas alkaloidigena]MDF9796016.1 putative SOS response-associated peptidase YedK [Catalinimonas alkaloidigena]